MLPLTGEGMWGEKRDWKRHRLTQSKLSSMPSVWYPGIWMLCSWGLARTQLQNPDARTDLELDNSSIKEAEAEGSLGLNVQPNLLGEFWSIKRPCLKSKVWL